MNLKKQYNVVIEYKRRSKSHPRVRFLISINILPYYIGKKKADFLIKNVLKHKGDKYTAKIQGKCAKTKRVRVKTVSDFTIFMRDNFRCIYCGLSSIEDSIVLNVDHIVPVYHSGETSISNLVTSCRKCNSQKGRLLLNIEDLKRVQKIVELRNSLTNENQKQAINEELRLLLMSHKIRVRDAIFKALN